MVSVNRESLRPKSIGKQNSELNIFRILINFILFIYFFKSFIYFNLAALGLSCCMWDLAPCPGIEPRPPALGALSLSHWTTREVPD